MIRRLPTWSLLLIGGVSVSLAVFTVVEVVVDHEATVSLVEVASSVVVAVVGVSLVVKARVRGRSRVRGSRSSGWSGGVGGLRVCRGGTMRHRLHACTSVDRLVDYLLEQALDKFPEGSRAQYAEEWGDHRQRSSGWRQVWWALCARATALRTATALPAMTEPGDRVDLMAPPTPEDPRNSVDLLVCASDGDLMAWEELFRRYNRLVRSTVASFRLQEADARDAVQNTWLRLAERMDMVRYPERLGGWLATTASRECLALIRRRRREIPDDGAGES